MILQTSGRAIASHASLRKPGYADPQNPSGFFGRIEDVESRRRLVRHVTDRELRRHWLFPFRSRPEFRAFAGENGGSLATGHIDNYVFNRGEAVDVNLGFVYDCAPAAYRTLPD
jgi:hypothetical protein